MKRYITYILSFVLISCITACTKSDDLGTPNGAMTLRLVSNTLTRSDIPDNGIGKGDNDNAEDAIYTVDFYFFAGNGNGPAVYHVSPTITGGDDGEVEISELKLDSRVMSGLFSSSNSAKLYVVANAPSNLLTTIGTLPTLAELKATTAVLSAWNTAAGTSAQESFLMDGEISFTKGTTDIIEVALTRAAAKIALEISSIEDEVEIEGAGGLTEVWEPVLDDPNCKITVSLANAMGSTRLDGTYDSNNTQNKPDNSQTGYGFTVDDTNTTYSQTNPFYSYSYAWAGASEPYLLLTVYWKEGNNSPVPTYYQIPVGNIEEKKIERNTFYKVKIIVGTVGSQEESQALPLEPSYTVIDWSTGDITANIKQARYLVVDQTNIVLNNLEDISIGFQSSHPVSYEIVSHTFNQTYSSSRDTWNSVYAFSTVTNGTGNVNLSNVTTDSATGKVSGDIVFNHELDNTREANGSSDPAERYDYQVNTVTIKVYHTDAESSYYEYITIEQRPAMYVDALYQSSSSVMINGQDDQSTSNWWHVAGTLGTRTTVFNTEDSKNIYAVSVSAFDASTSNYIICDPRLPAEDLELHTVSESNRNGTGEITGDRATYSDAAGNNEIKGYRGTIIEDSRNLVAPQFIMASGFGSHSLQTKVWPETTGKYRCATYQEAGYPAGRWRLPTPAELEVIGKMCSEGKIGSIFNPTTVYASSDGGYRYDNGSFYKPDDNPVATSVRCVYDIWYWGDKLNSNHTNTFIWATEENVADMKANGKYDTYMTSAE